MKRHKHQWKYTGCDTASYRSCTTCNLKQYLTTSVNWSKEDQQFVATCYRYPYLSALADTQAEADSLLKAAITRFLKDALIA